MFALKAMDNIDGVRDRPSLVIISAHPAQEAFVSTRLKARSNSWERDKCNSIRGWGCYFKEIEGIKAGPQLDKVLKGDEKAWGWERAKHFLGGYTKMN